MNAGRSVVDPGDVATRWVAAMRAGDWEAAWQQTDRIELPRRLQQLHPGFERQPHHLVWDGSPFEDRVVLVRCLHGLGDTLQFMRFVPQLCAQARELHFLVQPSLIALLEGAPCLGRVSNAWTDHPPAHEVEIEVMELAYAARATPENVPAPYPLAGHLRYGRRVAEEGAQLKVGLLWAASDWDRTRSIPFEALAPVLNVPGVRFYSLQQGEAARDPRAEAAGIVPLWRQTEAAEDAATAMLQMDLVIAVDGMPAHLAGTLGRPTWVLLKEDADWRWGACGESTAWYPTMRLFRQEGDGWGGVCERVAVALETTVVRDCLDSRLRGNDKR